MLKKMLKGMVNLFADNVKNSNLRAGAVYAHYYRHTRVKPKMVMYEAFFGRGMLDNPYALFLELLESPEYKHFQHIWVLDNPDDHKDLMAKYKSYSNVKFVRLRSMKYKKYLCQAKYLINNVTFPWYFTKKKEQIYVNTWHGIPLKTLGYDLPNGNIEASNTVRNFLHTDYLLSTSPFLTEKYLQGHKLDQIYNGKIIEEGYPRLDILKRFTRDQLTEKMRQKGMKLDAAKKTILYAPTWRGETYGKPDTDVNCYFEFKEKLEKCIDTDKYQIVIKVHQRVYQLAKDKLDPACFIPATIDGNEALAYADILISDFSSIFYDYLALDRPVLFYIPDLEEYKVQRGLYIGLDELPGPYTDDMDTLAAWICDIDAVRKKYKKVYEAAKKHANSYLDADSNISAKIIDIVFRGNTAGYHLVQAKQDKKKIFINRGVMLMNGISSSCLTLLNAIDYNKYDVTMMVAKKNDKNIAEMMQQINPQVRVLYRNSTASMSIIEQFQRKYREHVSHKGTFSKAMYREVRRCYADTYFDYLIDFEGYNLYYITLLLHMNGGRKIIWQHNDMQSERELKYAWLEKIFDKYKYFDRIVSCSEAIMKVNREKLGGIYCEKEKFYFAKNLIDKDSIIQKIDEKNEMIVDGQRCLSINAQESGGCIITKLVPICGDNVTDKRVVRFITVGRMSSEKNQTALIKAFARFQKEYIEAYLYILGTGPMHGELLALVSKLNLNGHVIMPGNVNNPFSVMKKCDCFILTSLHEGQPMVINEARVLKMPLIISNFSSVKGSMVENGQLIIGMTEDDIYNGLVAYMEGKVPDNYSFDIDAYNRDAYAEFERAVVY